MAVKRFLWWWHTLCHRVQKEVLKIPKQIRYILRKVRLKHDTKMMYKRDWEGTKRFNNAALNEHRWHSSSERGNRRKKEASARKGQPSQFVLPISYCLLGGCNSFWKALALQFLRSTGRFHLEKGMHIDAIMPLVEGGEARFFYWLLDWLIEV